MGAVRTTCKHPGCHADILLAWTRTGSRMPVDVDDDDTGNIVLITKGGQLHAEVFRDGPAAAAAHPGRALHLSHFVTCPGAADLRRRREQAKAAARPAGPQPVQAGLF